MNLYIFRIRFNGEHAGSGKIWRIECLRVVPSGEQPHKTFLVNVWQIGDGVDTRSGDCTDDKGLVKAWVECSALYYEQLYHPDGAETLTIGVPTCKQRNESGGTYGYSIAPRPTQVFTRIEDLVDMVIKEGIDPDQDIRVNGESSGDNLLHYIAE
jgi:hypothetical protein